MWWLKLRDDLPFWTSSRIYLVYHMETYERIKTKCSLSVISPDIPTPLPEEPDPVGRRWSNYWAHFCSHKYRRYLRFCPAINRRATLPTLKATGILRMDALKVGRGLPRVMRKLGSTGWTQTRHQHGGVQGLRYWSTRRCIKYPWVHTVAFGKSLLLALALYPQADPPHAEKLTSAWPGKFKEVKALFPLPRSSSFFAKG